MNFSKLFRNFDNFSTNFWQLFFTKVKNSNIAGNEMLGRKQSLKGEPVLADYGPEESLNESADIEWVNKVSFIFFYFLKKKLFKSVRF